MCKQNKKEKELPTSKLDQQQQQCVQKAKKGKIPKMDF